MLNILVVGVGIVAVVLFVRWMASGTHSSSDVIDITVTPQKRIEELTVEELHNTTQDYLLDRDFELRSVDGEGDYLAVRDGEVSLVKIDPAAQLRDPRKMNQLILNLRKSDAETGILVTTRSISGQSRSLADEADIRIVEPEELLDDPDD